MEMEQEMEEEMEQELFEEEDQFPEAEPLQEAEFGQGPRASLSLSIQEKNLIVQFLQQQCRAGALPHGSLKDAAKKFKVHARTVSRLWRIVSHQMEQGEPVVMKGKASGYTKTKGKINLDEVKFRHLSMLERSSIRKLAMKMQVSKTTAGRWSKANKIRPHTNAIKPALTDANKILRMRWCLTHIHPTIVEGKLLYHVHVHIDEKWFYMTKTSDRYYLLPDEDEPYRSCIFPFTEQVPAKRKSKNRLRGTLETKPIPSVNKEAMRECLLNRIIPAIKAKWPANTSKEIYIQQDNAKPHLKSSDLQFEAAAIWSSFEELIPQTLNKVFLSLQSCLSKILEVHGGNNYKIPHLNKDRLSRTVGLPTSLEVEETLVRESLEYLLLPENDVGGSYHIGHPNTVLGL
ncbi:uncharacterized protein LOC125186447 [Salvia hispanica]|uniref:uncharacterized protein LOC125186447 n=1 Tax=Salvia hispanica TaxID=49212 RepID=UPI002008FC95|nr:uncharacterized protein LOC125186447 [Salvia hispanica]